MDIEKQVQQDIDKLVQYRNKLEQEKIIQEREINLNAAKELISYEYNKPLTFWQKIKKYFSDNESENHIVISKNIVVIYILKVKWIKRLEKQKLIL